MPQPPPELRNLDYFCGTWISHGEIRPTEGTPGGTLMMTESYQWMEGGFFLTIRSQFSSPAGSGSGMAFMGYDAVRRLYTYDEFNSTGEAQHSTGTLEGGTWIWRGIQHLPHRVTHTRFSMKMLSASQYRFRFEISVDADAWTTVMEGEANKQTAG